MLLRGVDPVLSLCKKHHLTTAPAPSSHLLCLPHYLYNPAFLGRTECILSVSCFCFDQQVENAKKESTKINKIININS